MIKFRAWHKELKIMRPVINMFNMETYDCFSVDVSNLPFAKDDILQPKVFDWMLKEIQLMQWTGFTDSFGQDIYIGDIVAADDAGSDTGASLGVIHNDSEHHRVYCRWIGTSCDWCMFQLKYPDYDRSKPCNHKVVGNIYENSELLEGDIDAI